jgi:hypothetical protein
MPQALLEGRQEYVEPGSDLGQRIDALEARISDLEAERQRIMRDAVVALLNLLGQSLRHVASGKIDLDTIETSSDSGSSKWEAIKKRLPPRQAEAIDIFLAQGSLKRTQLAAAMRMDYSNCTKNVIAVLVRQGLLIESGGQLSLKDL